MNKTRFTLISFFNYNRDHEDKKYLLYYQFPIYYVFLQKEKV
jgi:hypothetical protein